MGSVALVAGARVPPVGGATMATAEGGAVGNDADEGEGLRDGTLSTTDNGLVAFAALGCSRRALIAPAKNITANTVAPSAKGNTPLLRGVGGKEE
jgi:hypothetical protein